MKGFRWIGRGARSIGHGFGRVGRVVVKPVTVPVSYVKERTQMAILMGVARHVLTAAGGALVTNGLVNAEQSTELVGALLTILGIVASVVSKRRAL